NFTLSTPGAILSGRPGVNITGGTVQLNATAIGTAGAPLGTTVTKLNAATTAGGIYVNETDGLTLGTVSAVGAGADVVVNSTTGGIVVGQLNAAGNMVKLNAIGGDISDDAQGAPHSIAHITCLHAHGSIGTQANGLDIATDILTAVADTGT